MRAALQTVTVTLSAAISVQSAAAARQRYVRRRWCCRATSGLCIAEVNYTVICEGMVVKNKNKKKNKMRCIAWKKTRGWASCYLSLVRRAIHLSGMCGWKIQVGSTLESPGEVCNTGGKELRLFRAGGSETKKKKKSGSPRASRDMRRRVCAICPVLRCIAGRAAINAREVLILLIKVWMRGFLKAASGSNEEPAEWKHCPHVDFGLCLWIGEIRACCGDHYFWGSGRRKTLTWLHFCL